MQDDLNPPGRAGLARLDAGFRPSRTAKDAVGVLNWMEQETRRARRELAGPSDVAYGAHPAERFDLYRCSAPGKRPTVVFIHGGFWQEGDKSLSGFAAREFAARGWHTVSLGYPLAPDVSLTRIVEAAGAGVSAVCARADELEVDQTRMVVIGHSAGAQLAGCMIAGLSAAPPLAGAILVSGVYDLAPVARSYVNDLAQITPEEVAALSPSRHAPRQDVPVHLLIGADEPKAFKAQTDEIMRAWGGAMTGIRQKTASGRDHFDILLELLASPILDGIDAMF